MNNLYKGIIMGLAGSIAAAIGYEIKTQNTRKSREAKKEILAKEVEVEHIAKEKIKFEAKMKEERNKTKNLEILANESEETRTARYEMEKKRAELMTEKEKTERGAKLKRYELEIEREKTTREAKIAAEVANREKELTLKIEREKTTREERLIRMALESRPEVTRTFVVTNDLDEGWSREEIRIFDRYYSHGTGMYWMQRNLPDKSSYDIALRIKRYEELEINK